MNRFTLAFRTGKDRRHLQIVPFCAFIHDEALIFEHYGGMHSSSSFPPDLYIDLKFAAQYLHNIKSHAKPLETL